MAGDEVVVALTGDVMLGRGIDQVLPRPGDPRLAEPAVDDARTYVTLAERVNGPIPRPVPPTWPWGEALTVLEEAAPHARVLNLETSVTRSDDVDPTKSVHYRMHPANLEALTAARPDICALANNHVLDYGRTGLAETLATLADAGLATAGAGTDLAAARSPAHVPLPDGRRLVVLSAGSPSSGIPPDWAARADRAGVDVVAETSRSAVARLCERVRAAKRPGDLVVVSVHWGSNWGHAVPEAQARLGRALVDAGADVVQGHSSHHPRPIEIHRGRLVLHGCGDLVNDYEGIRGHETHRPDLRLLFLAGLQARTGALAWLRLVPLRARRLRLERAPTVDAEWLRSTLERVSRPFGARVTAGPAGDLAVHPS